MFSAVKVRTPRPSPIRHPRFQTVVGDRSVFPSPRPPPRPLPAIDPERSLPLPATQSMRGAAAAKSAFDDPTKGGAVPQGRETAPSVVFSQCKDEKFHPSSRPSGYKRWFRRLRASFRPGALKDEISEHTLQGVDILVLGAPRAKFSVDEFDALKDFIRAGGSLLVLADEGGEEALGTNVNYLHSGRTKEKRYAFDRVFGDQSPPLRGLRPIPLHHRWRSERAQHHCHGSECDVVAVALRDGDQSFGRERRHGQASNLHAQECIGRGGQAVVDRPRWE